MKQDYYKGNKTYGDELHKRRKIDARERNVANRLKFIIKAGIVPPASLLEVGSHEGLFLKETKLFGFDVLGIEPNIYAANYANRMNLPTINGIFEEVFDKIKDRRFDIIALFHTLEHMPDYLSNLRDIKSIIKTEGYLIIEVPNSKSYRSKKYENEWVYVYEEHLHHFTPERLSKDLDNIGFRIKKIYFRDFDEMHMSIKQSLDRLLPFKFKNTNIKNKREESAIALSGKKTSLKRKIIIIILSPIRYFLAALARLLNRGDFMFVVAVEK